MPTVLLPLWLAAARADDPAPPPAPPPSEDGAEAELGEEPLVVTAVHALPLGEQ